MTRLVRSARDIQQCLRLSALRAMQAQRVERLQAAEALLSYAVAYVGRHKARMGALDEQAIMAGQMHELVGQQLALLKAGKRIA